MSSLCMRMMPWKLQMKMMRMEKLPATMMKASFALGGLQLNEVEDLLTLHDGFIGLPFIHRLTRTDVHLGMMQATVRATKMQKAKSCVLKIQSQKREDIM
ncbi:unnamed protein product [Triticum aestivum]|uniref:Uncharacterized protein n=1 Tax=Triticum aestivum TaxID=4565 RepID=A0A7H4LCE7_WHEAT|nr:unnamed protein product [Triticum aestivum]